MKSLGGNLKGVVTKDESPESESSPKDKDNSDCVTLNGKTYIKFFKKVQVKRKTSFSSNKSPWCKSSKRSYRRVLYYIDAQGHEFLASDVHSENKTEVSNDQKPESSPKIEEDEYPIEINGKKYKKVCKRVQMKRKTSGSGTKSPWCKPTKKRFVTALYYVDQQGNEIVASELKPENGDGEDTGKAVEVHVPATSPLKVGINSRRARSTSPISSRAASMSPKSRSAGTSPRLCASPKAAPNACTPGIRSRSRSKDNTSNGIDGQSSANKLEKVNLFCYSVNIDRLYKFYVFNFL